MSSSVDPFVVDVQEPCQELLHGLDELAAHLQPLVNHPTLGEYLETVSEEDRVNLSLMRSRVLSQLYYMYCSVNALDVQDHEITDELKRLDIYEAKLQAAKKLARSRPAAQEQTAATSSEPAESSKRARH